MLTKQDKDYIQQVVIDIVGRMFEDLKSIMVTKDELKATKAEIIGIMSNTSGEVQSNREEMTVFAHRQAAQTDQLDDHETRISKLEHTQ